MHELDPLDPLTNAEEAARAERESTRDAIAATLVALAIGVSLTCLVVLARLNTLSHLA